MTHAAKYRRRRAFKLTDALDAIEGVPVSDYARTLSDCWAKCKLTGEQAKKALLSFHRKLTEQESRRQLFIYFPHKDWLHPLYGLLSM